MCLFMVAQISPFFLLTNLGYLSRHQGWRTVTNHLKHTVKKLEEMVDARGAD